MTLKIAEVKLSYQNKLKGSDRPQVATSDEGFLLLNEWWNKETIEHIETFAILLLNRANRVLGVFELSRGGITGCVVDTRIVFQTAILSNATGLILAHNHPSGNLKPSQADIEITKKIIAAGKLLEIAVLDHLILSPENCYYSFADNGMM